MRKPDIKFSETKRILFGIAVGILTIILVCACGAWLMENEIIGESYGDIAAAIALLAGGYTGGMSVGKGESQLIKVISAGVGIVLILMLINLIAFGGNLSGLVPGLIIISGACVAVILTGSKRKNRNKHRRRKYTNR